MAAKLIVSRTSQRDIKMRDLYVIVDDEPERTVLFGRSTEFELAPGTHRLEVTNRLYSKTEEVVVRDGEEARFLAANVWAGGIFAWAVVILSGAYKVTLERI